MEEEVLYKITDQAKIRAMFGLCWLVYFSTYLGRLNYSAALAEMIRDGGFSKGQAGIIGTGFFFAYGAGQFVSGFLGDRLPPRRLVFAGLFVSGLCNLGMFFCAAPAAMTGIWCVNGLFQAFIWSPMIRLLFEYFETGTRMRACVSLNSSVPVGTMAAYGMTAGIIGLWGWRPVFLAASVLLLVIAFVWFWGLGALERYAREHGKRERLGGDASGSSRGEGASGAGSGQGEGVSGAGSGQEEGPPGTGQGEGAPRAGSGQEEGAPGIGQGEEAPRAGSGQREGDSGAGSGQREGGSGSDRRKRGFENGRRERGSGSGQREGGSGSGRVREGFSWKKLLLSYGFLILMAALFVQGALKDGVTTWVPTYISETYGLSAILAITGTMVIPVFNLVGVYLASFVNLHWFRDEMRTAGAFFAVCAVSLAVLFWTSGRSMAVSFLMLAAATTSMMAVNTMLIAVLPSYFGTVGRASSVSGLLNSSVYAGGAVSTYGIGALSAFAGWSATILCWTLLAAGAMCICFGLVRRWRVCRREVLKI